MDELLTRGVEQIIDRKKLEKQLASGRKLRIKFGVDPTRPDIHLGHTLLLRKLRALQDMGHTIIFLIGDYTTKIGDPSGKSKTRPMLTDDEIAANAKTYLDQVGLVLDVGRAEIRRNSEWLSKLSFGDLINLASNLSVAQLIERDDFKDRLESGKELALHELLYPLMQAYDSVALEADVEFGGNDQLFNLMTARALQKKLGQEPQQAFVTKLLVGTDGSKKMSKSLDNYISLTDAPVDMYGRVMSIPDNLIAPYYELCTDVEQRAIDELVKRLGEGANPRDAKASLAREIVGMYHGAEAALSAEEGWNKTFRDKSGPTEEQVQEVAISGKTSVLEMLVSSGAAESNSAARRLITQGGVKIGGKTVESEADQLEAGQLVQVGPRRFYRLTGR